MFELCVCVCGCAMASVSGGVSVAACGCVCVYVWGGCECECLSFSSMYVCCDSGIFMLSVLARAAWFDVSGACYQSYSCWNVTS